MPDPKNGPQDDECPGVPARGYGPDPDFIDEAVEAACAEAEAAGAERCAPQQSPSKPVEKSGKRNLEP